VFDGFLLSKTRLAADKTHVAHNDEIDKYEADLRQVERLRKDYEEKLQDECDHVGRNLALEEDQVNDQRIQTNRFYCCLLFR
jgi:hypothetical protein